MDLIAKSNSKRIGCFFPLWAWDHCFTLQKRMLHFLKGSIIYRATCNMSNQFTNMLAFVAKYFFCWVFFICMPYLCREVLQGQEYFGLVPVFDLKLLAMGW